MKSEILIYQTDDGVTKIQTRLENGTVWLTIDQMAELFQKLRSTINEHILNIYREGELEKDDSVRKIGNSDFSTKPTNFYNLDVIISVGYRVIRIGRITGAQPETHVHERLGGKTRCFFKNDGQ